MSFSTDWAQEIADVSGSPEFQRATIQIFDPAAQAATGTVENNWNPTYDPETAVYNGRARIVAVSGGTNVGGNTNSNPTNIITIRIQIPYDPEFPRVKRGWIVKVVDGGRNPRIETNVFIINSDVNSSNVASLTFVATTDVEANGNWS